MPVTEEFHEDKFFVAHKGVLMATPLFLAMLFVELTDVVFAVDSIPAVLAIIHRPVHRLHIQRLRHPGTAFAVLRAGQRPARLPLPQVRAGRHPGLRRREDAGVGVGGDPSLGLPGSDRCGPGRDHQPVPPQEQGQDHLPRARGVIRSATKYPCILQTRSCGFLPKTPVLDARDDRMAYA